MHALVLLFLSAGIYGPQEPDRQATQAELHFGTAVSAFLGDVDGDGFADLLVGSREEIRVLSWKRERVLARWPLEDEVAHARVAWPCADLNGDGFGDVVLVTTPFGAGEPTSTTHDGRTGALLRTFPSVRAMNVCDVDGDGVRDLLVFGGDLVSVWSGGSPGRRLQRIRERSEDRGGWGSGFCDAAWFIDDLDGDDVADVAIGLRHYRLGDGALAVASGKSGARLFRVLAPGDHEHFGSACAGTRSRILVLAHPWETNAPARLYLLDGESRKVLAALDEKTVAGWPRD